MDKKYKNLVFSGTNLFFINYIGIIKELEDTNILDNIKNYYGNSIGGLISLLVIIGYDSDELYNLFKSINLNKFTNIDENHILSLINNLGMNSHINLKKYITKLIKKKSYNIKTLTFNELHKLTNKDLNLVCTNITTETIELLNKENNPNMLIIDAILITMTLPLYFEPYKYNNNLYFDCTISNNFPINYCNMEETIGILCNNIDINKQMNEITTFIDYLLIILIRIIQNNNYTSYINNNNIILIKEINSLQFNIPKKEYKNLYNNGIKLMKDFLQNNK